MNLDQRTGKLQGDIDPTQENLRRTVNQIATMNLDQRTIKIQGDIDPAQENLRGTVNQMMKILTEQFLIHATLRQYSQNAAAYDSCAERIKNCSVKIFTTNVMNDVPFAAQEDWQEELYQKIQHMNESCGADIRRVYRFLLKKIFYNALDRRLAPNAINMDPRLIKMKKQLEGMLVLFKLSKNSMTQEIKQKMPIYEENIKIITNVRNKHRPHTRESNRRTMQVQGNPEQENLQKTDNQMNGVPIASHDDWQEELYQKIKCMNESYSLDLWMLDEELSEKILQALDRREASNAIKIDNMMKVKDKLDIILSLFQLRKHSMTQGLKEKIPIYEEKIKKLSLFTKARYKNRIHAGESSSSANQVAGVKMGNKRVTSDEPIRQVKPRLCRVCEGCAHNKRGE